MFVICCYVFCSLQIMRQQKKKQQASKKTTTCIACGMRQRTIERLDRVLSLSTNHEEQHVFLRCHDTEDDTLFYDPSHRIYQHYVKDQEAYERITVEPDVYSLQMFHGFLQELLSSTLDEHTLKYYDGWDVLFRCFQQKKSFWCSTRLEELFGVEGEDEQPDVLHRSEKKKKITFHFTHAS